MTKDTKEKIQYAMAAVLLAAGIVMGFVSFFLNEHDIEAGTLVFIAQCFIAAGSFVGIAVYIDQHISDIADALKRQ